MGVFDFLKKHDSKAIAPPSVPNGVVPISRSDEKLAPLFLPVTPSQKAPNLPPPALPPQRAPSMPGAPMPPADLKAPQMSVPAPLTAPKLPPLPTQNPLPVGAPKLPSLPVAPVSVLPSATPSGAPKLPPFPVAPAPRAPQSLGLPPLPAKPLAPIALPPQSSSPLMEKPFVNPSAPSIGATRLQVPQVTPTISATSASAPQTIAQPAYASKSSERRGASNQLPIQELRKVIAELRDIPLDLPGSDEVQLPALEEPKAPEIVALKPPAPQVTPVARVPQPTGRRHAFIPAGQFDESVLHIRGIHAAAAVVQAGNEKVGSIEAQAKAATDALAAACDSIQATLLSIDEKLFKVN